MEKSAAVASLGEHTLLMPAWVRAALGANDRLKLYFSVLQAAAQHAERPESAAIDLTRERVAAGIRDTWLDALPIAAEKTGDGYLLPDLPRLCAALRADLETMARPCVAAEPAGELTARTRTWLEWLDALAGDRLPAAALAALTHGDRGSGDGVHVLVMDLHKALNRLASDLAKETIDGAHVWGLLPADRARVRAFMRGLNRTAPLRFDHPGLDTAATRDGDRLIVQNDIGTNDAHVLVVTVEPSRVTLTYSDLHETRFRFFQDVLAERGAQWSVVAPTVQADLNAGETFYVGTATFDCPDPAAQDAALDFVGSRIVFLIDWNRARKRLQMFVAKRDAIAILRETARRDVGHMGWLRAGGADLVFRAMQDAGYGVFRIGDRLADALGDAGAREFLVDVMVLAGEDQLRGRPQALTGEETRLLLLRRVRDRSSEFDLVAEHAAYCHELASAVRDAVAASGDATAITGLPARAKSWERGADELVSAARAAGERHPRRQPIARLLALADDVADALEEAVFVLGLVAERPRPILAGRVREPLTRLADTLLAAVQDYVRALAIARGLRHGEDLDQSNALLDAVWRIDLAERRCDEHHRAARRAMVGELDAAADLMLAADLAAAIELASDRLLASGYAMRELALAREGGGT
ncbi:MAG: phosphate transport regulator [Betaproteobacteria bacterium]|nr:phosphate transport regulator [Betaproteobacteria bacterium]